MILLHIWDICCYCCGNDTLQVAVGEGGAGVVKQEWVCGTETSIALPDFDTGLAMHALGRMLNSQ